jgi:hypothetical protein
VLALNGLQFILRNEGPLKLDSSHIRALGAPPFAFKGAGFDVAAEAKQNAANFDLELKQGPVILRASDKDA